MLPQCSDQTFGSKINIILSFFLIIRAHKVALGAVKADVDAVRADVDAGPDFR